MKTSFYLSGFIVLLSLISTAQRASGFTIPPGREYYQIKIYTIANKHQEDEVDQFLKSAYLPALHRAGIAKAGVFKPVETDTALYGKRIFVLIPFSSLENFDQLEAKLLKDADFQAAAKNYWDAAFDNAPYNRIESVMLRAFVGMSQFQVPKLSGPGNQRVYELRSYESATEKLYINKVQMFNAGDEIGLFKRLSFNAVFYGEVISGSRMPNLMYMTSFDNMTSRDEHWKAFVNDPQWKKLSVMPEYQHNVSKNNIYLLHPADYSEL